jgi:hypothetical protein
MEFIDNMKYLNNLLLKIVYVFFKWFKQIQANEENNKQVIKTEKSSHEIKMDHIQKEKSISNENNCGTFQWPKHAETMETIISQQEGEVELSNDVKDKLKVLGIFRERSEGRQEDDKLEFVAMKTGRRMIVKNWMIKTWGKFRNNKKACSDRNTLKTVQESLRNNMDISHRLEKDNNNPVKMHAR